MIAQGTAVVKFDDQELPELSFNFNDSNETKKQTLECQTDELEYVDSCVSTEKNKIANEVQFNSSEVQTPNLFDTNYNEKELVLFLSRVTPYILEAISENSSLKNLSSYQVKWTERIADTKIIYTLYNKVNHLYEKDNNLQFTSLSWNATGMIIAIALGRFEHEGACEDRSFIYLWNINRRDLRPDAPHLCIETSCCIMSLAFHPLKPSLLAAGSYNGEISLYDISRPEDHLIKSTIIDEYFHRECLTQLSWILQSHGNSIGGSPGNRTVGFGNNYNLYSMSTDGRLLIWQIGNEEDIEKGGSLQTPTKGFTLLRKKDGFVSNVGGLSFSQSIEDKSSFIIGTEAGSILRAYMPGISLDRKQKVLFEQKLEGNKSLKWKDETYPFMFNLNPKNVPEIKLFVEEWSKKRGAMEINKKSIFESKPELRKIYGNPISGAFEPHLGPVYSVSFSPFHRNLFLSCSMDGSIRIYDLLQNKPVCIFDNGNNYVFKTEWSPVRPCVFAAISSNGEILFYDLSKSKPTEPLRIIKSEENEAGLSIEFNKHQKDLMAAVYSSNKVKIIQLSEDLMELKEGEISIIGDLAD